VKKYNKFKLYFMQNRKGKIFYIFSILLLVMFFVTGCNNEIFKEGKNENTTQQTILVELYITEGCPACAVVEPFLEQLAEEYTREKMILVESPSWGLYSTPEISYRYRWYFPERSEQGVPNTLFNGLADRIHGINDYETIKEKIEVLSSQQPMIELKATRNAHSANSTFSGKVKNIGSSTLTNLVINGMAFTDREKTGFRYSVVDIFEDEKVTISSLAPGQERDFTISVDRLDWEVENLDGVIFVQSEGHEKKVIRQSTFVD
jgi:thiol-disulfide isomerase/thioredoxin